MVEKCLKSVQHPQPLEKRKLKLIGDFILPQTKYPTSVKLMTSHAGENAGKGDTCSLWVGEQTSPASIEVSVEFPQKAENGATTDPTIPLLGMYPKDSTF